GKVIVTVSPEGTVRRFDANTGRLLERRQLGDRADVNPAGQSHARLCTDASTVAIDDKNAAGRRVTVWDVAAAKILLRLTSVNADLGGYAMSPDGKQLAVVECTGEHGR